MSLKLKLSLDKILQVFFPDRCIQYLQHLQNDMFNPWIYDAIIQWHHHSQYLQPTDNAIKQWHHRSQHLQPMDNAIKQWHHHSQYLQPMHIFFYSILFYPILFYLILSYFILFYLILLYFILFYFIPQNMLGMSRNGLGIVFEGPVWSGFWP